MQFKVPGGGNKRKDKLKMTCASGCEGGSTTYWMINIMKEERKEGDMRFFFLFFLIEHHEHRVVLVQHSVMSQNVSESIF